MGLGNDFSLFFDIATRFARASSDSTCYDTKLLRTHDMYLWVTHKVKRDGSCIDSRNRLLREKEGERKEDCREVRKKNTGGE